MTYSDLLYNMWFGVFGSYLLGGFALLGMLIFLCHIRGYTNDPILIVAVIFPTFAGITLDSATNPTAPRWLFGLMLILIGLIVTGAFKRKFLNG